MPRGRGCEFLGVTSLAFLGARAAVRLVTAHANLVPSAHGSLLGSMTGDARAFPRGRQMREPPMAVLTSRVSRALGGQTQLLFVTALTQLMLRQVELEVVRFVATLTGHGAMECALVLRRAMAAAAGLRDHPLLAERRVGIVAGHAGVAGDALGVIGVHGSVTIGASAGSCRAHVVRSVTTRAHGVRGDLGLTEHDHLLVTRATAQRAIGLERVWLVAAGTRAVPARK